MGDARSACFGDDAQAARRPAHRAGGLHRGIGQGHRRHAADLPDHAGRHPA